MLRGLGGRPVIRSSGDTLSSPHVIPRCAKSRGGLNASDAPLAVLKKREGCEPFWLKCCTFVGGPVPPPCIGGEARGCLESEAVPSRELPSPFPAVLEQTYLLPLCFREPDRCGQP